MGKKSKRKNNNNKSPPCYHGCITKKNFNSGENYKVLEGWDNTNTGEKRIKFYETHERVINDPTFGNFIIAHVTSDYLKGKDDATLLRRLMLLLDMRYDFIPRNEGKDVGPETEYTRNNNKYCRDVQTERGRINCMAREIPCDCMEEKRIEAKSMEKVAVCWCCLEDFPKKKMLRCKGCDNVQYCSKECSITHWPRHKEYCNNSSVSFLSTPAPTPTPNYLSIVVVGVMVMIGAVVVIVIMKYRPVRMLELEEF